MADNNKADAPEVKLDDLQVEVERLTTENKALEEAKDVAEAKVSWLEEAKDVAEAKVSALEDALASKAGAPEPKGKASNGLPTFTHDGKQYRFKIPGFSFDGVTGYQAEDVVKDKKLLKLIVEEYPGVIERLK